MEPETFEAYRRGDGEDLWDEYHWVTFSDWDDAASSLNDSEERFPVERCRFTVEVLETRELGRADEPCDQWQGRPAHVDPWFTVERGDVDVRDVSRLLAGSMERSAMVRFYDEMPDPIHVIDCCGPAVITVPKSEYQIHDRSRERPPTRCETCGHDQSAHGSATTEGAP